MPPSSQIVTLNFGNAGSGIGSAMVDSMLQMHGNPSKIEPSDGLCNFFDMADEKTLQARVIFADLDCWTHPSVAAGVKRGLYKVTMQFYATA